MDRKQFEEWFKTTLSYAIFEDSNVWKVDLYAFNEPTNSYLHLGVQAAFESYHHQQAKVEELEHDKEFAENSAQEWTAKAIEERNAKLELQKRVDAALETIAKVKQDTTERDTYLELEELEQALKGEGQ
ncbi:hypothetical protein [Acinetobacter baumannii]|uniref:hypothetical protein n=1 Tax=Acinetobacter baumannii TaxID=470 RepID=UPI00396CD90A